MLNSSISVHWVTLPLSFHSANLDGTFHFHVPYLSLKYCFYIYLLELMSFILIIKPYNSPPYKQTTLPLLIWFTINKIMGDLWIKLYQRFSTWGPWPIKRLWIIILFVTFYKYQYIQLSEVMFHSFYHEIFWESWKLLPLQV